MADERDSGDPFDFMGFSEDESYASDYGFEDEFLDHIYEHAVSGYDSPEMRDLFERGWEHMTDDSKDARDEFEAFLREHGIDLDDVFDWDDWREWYESA